MVIVRKKVRVRDCEKVRVIMSERVRVIEC